MKSSKLRGHKIEYTNKEWLYCDTKKSTILTHKDRECGNCGRHKTKDGHDSCLGIIPGVINACCGHGNKDEAYLQALDGTVIQGKIATIIISIIKRKRSEIICY